MANFVCPLCSTELLTQIDADNNGLILYCANTLCPAQEVFGHGKNQHQAYFIILEKYKHKGQDRTIGVEALK